MAESVLNPLCLAGFEHRWLCCGGCGDLWGLLTHWTSVRLVFSGGKANDLSVFVERAPRFTAVASVTAPCPAARGVTGVTRIWKGKLKRQWCQVCFVWLRSKAIWEGSECQLILKYMNSGFFIWPDASSYFKAISSCSQVKCWGSGKPELMEAVFSQIQHMFNFSIIVLFHLGTSILSESLTGSERARGKLCCSNNIQFF